MQCDAEFLYSKGVLFCMREKGHGGLHENYSVAGGKDYKTVWGRVPMESSQPINAADMDTARRDWEWRVYKQCDEEDAAENSR